MEVDYKLSLPPTTIPEESIQHERWRSWKMNPRLFEVEKVRFDPPIFSDHVYYLYIEKAESNPYTDLLPVLGFKYKLDPMKGNVPCPCPCPCLKLCFRVSCTLGGR
ncbi:hypothetical protein MPTK1_1g23900 [Marchantia polymorpha subsp. ruderalis]|uniref:Uncharacterized protein n=2 Tax=Marchantia polymorpha TaxID=3197 RepID=A0AAF6ATM7_MARPO|nr:hypothetical protein MARPO_0061s0130 [Marchantia polymorpha]BBM99797.1 hypothetical protein Mp_1g23900 [Marchantia polymorpha subsp. ruderalis]|eukprot:PTQ36887.1 hypothetical protein MARPO_0061s0130 [Marchantia polymorpha]